MPLMALIENSFDLVVAGDDPVGVGEAAGLDQDLALVGSDMVGGVSRESAGLGVPSHESPSDEPDLMMFTGVVGDHAVE